MILLIYLKVKDKYWGGEIHLFFVFLKFNPNSIITLIFYDMKNKGVFMLEYKLYNYI